EEVATEIDTDVYQGQPEGAKKRAEINKYERKKANRNACIALRGTTCIACGFNFSDTYGAAGEGFIVVHHIVPISKIGENYVIDPLNDLIPVCANCHLMIHRKDPPYSIDEIKQMIDDK
ncbi:MAG TPA: HNH endonuclease, partial [Anaerolineales bacterium]|nr:HNH endonuclease [Anaerolineales bacterium]